MSANESIDKRRDFLLVGSQSPSTIIVGKLRIYLTNPLIFWDNKEVRLTRAEYKTLYLLAKAVPGAWVSYREIYDVVQHVGFVAGSGEDGYRTNVRSIIKRTRNKIKAIDPNAHPFENYPDVGYRFKRE